MRTFESKDMSKKPQLKEGEFHPDAWARFEKFIRDVAKAGPQHRKPKTKARKSPVQRTKSKQMPTKSRDWLEAECLRLARLVLGGKEIQRVTIRRLSPKGTGPNWKVADIIPQPTPLVSEHVRAALAHLTGAYSLEEE